MHYNHTIYTNFREYANFENRVVKTMVAMVTSMFIVGIVCLWQPPRWLPTVIKDIKSPWTQITVETCSGKQQKMYCLQSNMLCIVWIQLLYSLHENTDILTCDPNTGDSLQNEARGICAEIPYWCHIITQSLRIIRCFWVAENFLQPIRSNAQLWERTRHINT